VPLTAYSTVVTHGLCTCSFKGTYISLIMAYDIPGVGSDAKEIAAGFENRFVRADGSPAVPPSQAQYSCSAATVATVARAQAELQVSVSTRETPD
jgi:hypothetical protein